MVLLEYRCNGGPYFYAKVSLKVSSKGRTTQHIYILWPQSTENRQCVLLSLHNHHTQLFHSSYRVGKVGTPVALSVHHRKT